LNFQIRLTLDYEEDYWLLCSLVRILGNEASYKDVIQFLMKNPDFYKINSFRNDEWKNSQKSKGESLQINQK
jgi:spore coat polysaccharide biosynthesis protein SpsF (cytidylyltransferase family)